MLVWSGRGFLVPLLAFGGFLLAEVATEAAFHDDRYYQERAWPMILGFALGAVFADLARRRLMRDAPDRVLTGEATGERVVVAGPRHSFLFVPVRYWPALLVVIGAGVALTAP